MTNNDETQVQDTPCPDTSIPDTTPPCETVPEYMRTKSRWTVFRRMWNEERKKYDKIPCMPNGDTHCPPGYPDLNNPKHLTSYGAMKALSDLDNSFVPAFYLLKADGLLFIDFDQPCEKPEYPTYTELSISGGYHVLGWYVGELPIIPGVKERYKERRWIVLTGDVVDDKHDINDINDFIASIEGVKINPVSSPSFKLPMVVTEGQRDITLFRMACSLRARGLHPPEIEAALLTANQIRCKPPYPVDKVISIAARMGKYPQGCVALPEGVSKTQIQFADKFVAVCGLKYLFNVDFGTWMVWDGKRWKKDKRLEIKRDLQKFLKDLLSNIAGNTSIGKELNEVTKFYAGMNSSRGVKDILSLLEALLAVEDDDFDKDPYLLNVQNGTIDLKSVSLDHNGGLNHDAITFYCHIREESHARITGANYLPEAECPNWLTHLNTVFDEDKDLIKNYQELCGYTLFGANPDAILAIFTGGGRNGKTACQNTVKTVLGDYAIQVKTEALMVGGEYAGHGRIYMKGARLIAAAEPPDTEVGRATLDSNFIKAATGDEEVYGREFRCMPIKFKIFGLVCLLTNKLPRITDQSVAIWDRLWVFPFNHYFKPEDRNPAFVDSLGDEIDGILLWMLEGFARYRKNRRMIQCKSVRDQTSEYRKEEDPYDDFFEFVTSGDKPLVLHPDFEIPSNDLFAKYLSFFTMRYGNVPDRKPVSKRKFAIDMGSKFGKRESHGQTLYIGIGDPHFAENKSHQTAVTSGGKEKSEYAFVNFEPDMRMIPSQRDAARVMFCNDHCGRGCYPKCTNAGRKAENCNGVPIP